MSLVSCTLDREIRGVSVSEWFGFVAGVIGIVGYAPYIRDILRKTTKPDRIAWLIWTFEYAALFFAQISAGAAHSLWIIGLQLVGVIVIFGLSVRYGTGGLSRHAIILLACVSVALFVWFGTQNAAYAIIILIAVEASGVVLTVAKTYKKPDSETLSLWYCIAFAGVLGIPAVGMNAAPILYLYPISLILMSVSVIAAVYLGTRKQREDLIVEHAVSDAS